MICTKCGKENHQGSKFCRFCGNKLSGSKHIKISISPKVIFLVIVLILIAAGIVYAAPRAMDYYSVQNAITQAQTLESSGQYQPALDMLMTTQGKWTMSSIQSNINLLEQKEQKYIAWEKDYNTALTDIASSSYDDAQTLLQGIDPSYPQYSLVKNELIAVQQDIQDALNAKIQSAEQSAATQKAAAVAAEQNAKAREAAAAAAQEQAETATQNATADNNHVVDQAFYNQLQSIYTSVNGDGIDDYNSGNSDYDEGTEVGYLDAINAYSNAETVFKTAYTDATGLNTYTNMPQGYVTAGENMATAASDFYLAASLSITNAGNAADDGAYASPDSDSAEGNSLMTNVLDFLNSTSP